MTFGSQKGMIDFTFILLCILLSVAYVPHQNCLYTRRQIHSSLSSYKHFFKDKEKKTHSNSTLKLKTSLKQSSLSVTFLRHKVCRWLWGQLAPPLGLLRVIVA